MKKQRCGHPIKAREVEGRRQKERRDDRHQSAEKHGASHHGHHRHALEELPRLYGIARRHDSADDGPGKPRQIELRNIELALGNNERHAHRSEQKTDHHPGRRFRSVHDHFPKRHPQWNGGQHNGRRTGIGIVNGEHEGKLPAINKDGAEKYVAKVRPASEDFDNLIASGDAAPQKKQSA